MKNSLKRLPSSIFLAACRLCSGVMWFVRIIGNATYRFYWDDCFSRASSLSYATLFALVPGFYIAINMLLVFGVSEEQVGKTVERIVSGMLPALANTAVEELQAQLIFYLERFRYNMAALKTISLILLMVSAISLINTIESALNVVWRSNSSKGVVTKVVSFWAVITLGPILVFLSFYSSTYLTKAAETTGLYNFVDNPGFNIVLPISVLWIGLTLIFYNLPSARVRLADAAVGGLVGAVLFEALKWSFAAYLGNASTYNTIYGVLAAVPVILFWMYLAWVVVLFGAEVAYQAGNIHIFLGLKKYATGLGEVGVLLGLRALQCIGKYFIEGRSAPEENEVAIETGADPVVLRTCLDVLTDAGLLTPPEQGTHRRALAISPHKLKVSDVVRAFHSDEYRHRLAQQVNQEECEVAEEVYMLAMIKQAANRLPVESELNSWTLVDLIGAGQQR